MESIKRKIYKKLCAKASCPNCRGANFVISETPLKVLGINFFEFTCRDCKTNDGEATKWWQGKIEYE